ncbi:MAG TPA: hypothetical protein VJO13_03850 [Ktedonobacterales bacterium]|nr:hypothetical protein [Ktedonobacterales bacterium]
MSMSSILGLSLHRCGIARCGRPLASLPSESGEQQDIYKKPHNQNYAQPERYHSVF